MQNSTSKEYGELIALWDARRKILELLEQESWWTLEEWIKSWRTTVRTPVTKEWRDKIEGWKE